MLQLLQGNCLQVPSGMTKLIPSRRKTGTNIGNESDKGIIIANREKEERNVDAENEAETDTTNKPFDIIPFISRNTFKATDMMQWSEFIDENGHLDVRELEQAHQEASNDATVTHWTYSSARFQCRLERSPPRRPRYVFARS